MALLLSTASRPWGGDLPAAGNLHAYVRGFGVEVMANSDTAITRWILPKKMPELLREGLRPHAEGSAAPPIRREGLGLVF